jgi:DNA-directed RNA polymerase sigma subunit (sigma70/sigma32)
MDKEQELKTWKRWKRTKDYTHLNQLLSSMEPYLQSHVNKFASSPLPRQAIESQARILAWKAFHTYDPNKGAALNTHLGHELKHLTRFVLEYQNVGKIPENRGIAISKFQNIKSNLTEEIGREPTVLELSDRLQWSTAEVERMQTELRQDLNVIQGKEESFFDTGYHVTDQTNEIVQFVYHSVSPEEQKILEYSFGIGGASKLSVDDMALKLNKTPTQIRTMRMELARKIHEAGGQ